MGDQAMEVQALWVNLKPKGMNAWKEKAWWRNPRVEALEGVRTLGLLHRFEKPWGFPISYSVASVGAS